MIIFALTANNLEKLENENISWIKFLQSFGKSILVLIYTTSWINEYENSIPILIDPVVWRWINIYLAIGIYSFYLIKGQAGGDD